MKNEFVLAFNEMVEEKQLPREIVIKALESAMVSAYRKAVVASSAQHVEAKMDADTGSFAIFAEKEVVSEVMDDRTEVLLEEARKVNPEAELGDMVIVDSTPSDFGRVAAQTARQVIQQRLRDAERQDQVDYFEKRIGEIVNGVVQSISSEGYSIGLDRKAEGMLPRKDMIRGEHFRLHQHVRALVVEVKDSNRNPQIMLSRTDRKFLFRLLEIDVPEIYHGIVEVRSIAREPGARAKIAVSATQQGIDPVGACVGMQGKRIQPIVKELHDEKIDVIEWNPDPVLFIAKAISPAKVVGVYLSSGKNATVIVPEDQLSLAIGRDGQNARLAAKLTNWRIDIKSVLEAASDILGIYESKHDIVGENPETGESMVIASYKDLFKNEKENIEPIRAMLAKRAEGRTLSPDEVETLNRFVDRIEKRKVAGFNDSSVSEVIDKLIEENVSLADIQKKPLKEAGIPKHIVTTLTNNGNHTFGDLFANMMQDPDEIYKLQGFTPKIMNEIASLIKFMGMLDQREKDRAAELEAEALESMVEEAEEEQEEVIAVEDEPFVDLTEVEPVIEEVETEPVQAEEFEDVSFDELFNQIRVEAPAVDYSDEDDNGDEMLGKKGKKKKKKRHVEIEYDPDNDITTVRKKRKRGGDEEWGW